MVGHSLDLHVRTENASYRAHLQLRIDIMEILEVLPINISIYLQRSVRDKFRRQRRVRDSSAPQSKRLYNANITHKNVLRFKKDEEMSSDGQQLPNQQELVRNRRSGYACNSKSKPKPFRIPFLEQSTRNFTRHHTSSPIPSLNVQLFSFLTRSPYTRHTL